ncbi:MAG: DUF4153 domain-containing protein [Chakrabartia sp.]
MSQSVNADHGWPQRSWGLACAGVSVGLALYFLTSTGERWQMTESPIRLSLATFLAVAGIAFAFVVERTRLPLSIIFAGIAGLVMASIVYWSGGPDDWGNADPLRLACGAIAVAVAAPLFQAWRDAGAQRSSQILYATVHDRAWTNVVLWFASWAFVGIVWLLTALLSELFGLIGITIIKELMREEWFAPVLTGGAFGGAVGLLRDREKILGTLQRVVTTVLSVLAPVLGVGLVVFLLALPFTGLKPLWDATSATTPILITCVIGALILANAVIGDTPEDEAKLPVLRWGAMALGAAMLPLGIIAALSTGLRIDQHGLTPDRLWALVACIVACAYGIAYLVALARRRMGWAADVRPANLKLAFGLCGLALLLSTPFVSFNALSTRDQVSRLTRGKIAPDKFDWTALKFDFGGAGKKALNQLAKNGKTDAIRKAALAAQKIENRWDARSAQEKLASRETLDARLIIVPQKTPLPDDLRTRLVEWDACATDGACVLQYSAGATSAIVVRSNCETCEPATIALEKREKGWTDSNQPQFVGSKFVDDKARDANRKRLAAAIARGEIEVRTIKRRQVYVEGKPVGQEFE